MSVIHLMTGERIRVKDGYEATKEKLVNHGMMRGVVDFAPLPGGSIGGVGVPALVGISIDKVVWIEP